MKALHTDNDALLEILSERGISITCNDDMQKLISDGDAKRIPSIVEQLAPAAAQDYTIEDYATYDVFFNDEAATDHKGFSESLEYCREYIRAHNGTTESYFADYKGGIVSVVCNETGETVYEEEVR